MKTSFILATLFSLVLLVSIVGAQVISGGDGGTPIYINYVEMYITCYSNLSEEIKTSIVLGDDDLFFKAFLKPEYGICMGDIWKLFRPHVIKVI